MRQEVRHTVAMRRGVCLLVLCVLVAAFGVGSARADGVGSTTTATTTAGTTTTTTTTTPPYAPLPSSSLPAGCLGAGDAALVLPGHPVIALGSPASDLGPSGYALSSGQVLGFDSSSASGSACKSAAVTLSSVSLFDGVVSVSSVQATDGRGTATGLEIDGAAVSATAGETVPVEGWGQLTLGATVGRITAPLVLRLLQAHDSLPAGTAVAVAFAVSAVPVAKPKHNKQTHGGHPSATAASHAGKHPAARHHSRKHSRRRPRRPPPDFPVTPYPFTASGGLAPALRNNAVVSIAMHYLGVPYLWGGARPRTGFDCSGLVKYVFAKLGVPLTHYAAAQWHAPDSVWVAPNELKPGDLVFFVGSDGTRKAPGHVGIYVDDGYIVDAPHTGSFVRIDRLSERSLANGYVGARRVVSPSLKGGRPLLIARHLLHATKARPSAGANPVGFSPLAFGLMGGRPGFAAEGIAAAPTAAHTSAARRWMGVGFAGALLLLLPAAVGYRRRRRRAPEASPSTDSSD
jgi:cell wall-associated NlpC family hydrolase